MSQLIEYTNNNALLVAGTVLMALAVIFYELRMRSRAVAEITANQAVRLINQGARVVDVRDEAAWRSSHIIDSINIPAPQLASADDKRLKKNKPIILVCDNGATSGRCADTLRKAGFESVFSLGGGVGGWQRDNLPLVGAAAGG
jgi:rhodanese-related sulfurtransferase